MNTLWIPIFCAMWMAAGCGTAEMQDETAAVQNAVVEGYIEGIVLKGDAGLVKKWWHEACEVVVLTEDGLQKIPVSGWVSQLEQNPGTPFPGITVTHEFEDVKVTGTAALAVVRVFFDGIQKYTDYLNLYKFGDGWKIVTKTYYTHF